MPRDRDLWPRVECNRFREGPLVRQPVKVQRNLRMAPSLPHIPVCVRLHAYALPEPSHPPWWRWRDVELEQQPISDTTAKRMRVIRPRQPTWCSRARDAVLPPPPGVDASGRRPGSPNSDSGNRPK